MRIAVISDLHLGTGGADDSFGHDDGDFLRFLDFLEHEVEQIVLLGDIWETLSGPVRRWGHGDSGTEFRRAQAAHPLIAERFSRKTYRYVHGNHDLVAARLAGAPDHLLLEADGMRLLFTHGHQYEWIHRRARILSELAISVGGWLRRHGLELVYRWAERIEAAWSSEPTAVPASAFQLSAIAHARDRGADVVVTGHTHVLTRGDHGREIFLNSGTCKDGRRSFLAIDTRSGEIGVHAEW
ncbi:MAG: metallophosphoesterase family protein [Polyangiaceae bacterium]|nr:metallophosphoesterase family protein [Polyangiaceae bacterium]